MVRTCESFKISARNLNFKGLHIIIPQAFKIKTPNVFFLGVKILGYSLQNFQDPTESFQQWTICLLLKGIHY